MHPEGKRRWESTDIAHPTVGETVVKRMYSVDGCQIKHFQPGVRALGPSETNS